ncbi:MAG: GEVED domain-containing protein, partial [Planctomycetota bacterium]|nr:GEVED domain-containing protein [Planctomycetota bacterium]
TANNVHVFLDLPAATSDETILQMLDENSQASQIDRDLFSIDLSGVTHGNHVATVVSFEASGNVNVQRYPGLFTSTIFGAGLGDLDIDGDIDADDLSVFETVLLSNNTIFNPAGDFDADGDHDLYDLSWYHQLLLNMGASPNLQLAFDTLVENTATLDFGDAPDPLNATDGEYPTLIVHDGARHLLEVGPFLGSGVDADPDGQPDGNSMGDDGDGFDDEEGVTIPPFVVQGQTSLLDVVASDSGFLNAFLDLNGDGDWIDAGEQFANDLPLVAGLNSVAMPVPGTATMGSTVARFRFDTFGNLDATGLASNGEVEDYAVEILSQADFGDAPAPYPVLRLTQGAVHEDGGPQLGSLRDLEADGTPSPQADGDGADEDGVVLGAVLAGQRTHAEVTVTGQGGLLDAWLDFNGDGDWQDAGEQVFDSVVVNVGLNELAFDVPADATQGVTFSRFRLSSAGELAPTGPAEDGEVEDYRHVIYTNPPPTLDAVADVTIDEDAPEQVIDLSGIFAGGGESQRLAVSATSSNPVLLSDPVVDYTSPEETGTLRFTPESDQSGTSTIVVTVEDGGLDDDLSTKGDNATFSQSFELTVNPVNDVPSFVTPLELDFNESVAGFQFNLREISSGPHEDQPLEFSISTDNGAFLSDFSIDYSNGTTGTVTFSTTPGELGRGNLIIRLEDGGLDGDLDTAEDNLSTERIVDVAVTAKKRTYALSDQTIFGEIEGTYRDTYWKNSYSQSIKETLFRAYKRSRLEHRWEFDMAGADVSMEFFVYASHDATNEQFRFQYQVEGSSQWKTLVTTTQNDGKQYSVRVVDPDLATDGKVTLRVADTLRTDEDERATVTVGRIFFLSRRLTNMDDAVNVLVFDPEGAEGGGNKAQFRFQLADRNRLDHDVEVFYELAGTAQNSDYREFLRGSKVIKAGNLMTRLFVTPKSDDWFEGAESVTVRILENEAYRLTGDPEATVKIMDGDLVTRESYGEVTLYGSHDLNYPQGYYLDDQWESVTEEIYAGGNRARMDHRWKFDLSEESEMIFRGRFEITSAADQDDFQVVYSADGNSWKPLGRVGPGGEIVDLEKRVSLPEGVSQVWVRMFDRFRKNGDTTPTTVAIDHLCFERVESSSMPPVMFFSPAPAMMPGAALVRRPVDEELFELLGQENVRWLEELGEKNPGQRKAALDSFYGELEERNGQPLGFSQWWCESLKTLGLKS